MDKASTNIADRSEVSERYDVTIVGGGIIGLSIGWRIARRGLTVAVFDRDEAGAGTSRAATGMLAAAAEVEPAEDDLLPLTLESQRLWPQFAREVEAESGQSVDYRSEGTLVVALAREEVERLRFRFDLQQRLGIGTQWLSGLTARQREPGLRPGIAAAIYCPQDHQVDPRRVTRALARAFQSTGGRLFEQSRVDAIDYEGGRATGLFVGGQRIAAGTVVLATGAWAPELVDRDRLRLPVRPLKGQSIALRMDPRLPALDHVIWTEQIHMAPKGDGRLIIGATVEEKGFEQSNTAGGLFALLEAARRVLPAMEELQIDEFWAGFRPTSPDDAPILGPSGIEGLVLATGHHRNGILLAPVSARAIEALVCDGAMKGPEQNFALARFETKTMLAAAQG